MKTKIRKWGNSLALRIPKAFAAETRLKPGSDIELETAHLYPTLTVALYCVYFATLLSGAELV